MQDKLIDIKNEALAQIMSAADASTLENIRIDYLGKSKGKITLIMKIDSTNERVGTGSCSPTCERC